MRCHEVDFEIFGQDMQIVEVELDPGETVIAEAGAMNYMEDGIAFEARMGDGSAANEGLLGKMLNVGKRVLTKESIFLTHFTNEARAKRRVAFAAPYPGKIVPINMAKVGGEFFCQRMPFSLPPWALKWGLPLPGGWVRGFSEERASSSSACAATA